MTARLRRLLLVPAALLAASAAPAASAQMLPSGTWTGTLAAAGGTPQAVEAEIERCETGFSVDLSVAGRAARTETATWERGRLQFRLPALRLPDARAPRTLACALDQQDDGALAGVCRAGRTAYRLRLAPPADAAFGCD